jgi:hypothetical protein
MTTLDSKGDLKSFIYNADLTQEGINCLINIFCNENNNVLSQKEKSELSIA